VTGKEDPQILCTKSLAQGSINMELNTQAAILTGLIASFHCGPGWDLDSKLMRRSNFDT
jgi:hypothetical protein